MRTPAVPLRKTLLRRAGAATRGTGGGRGLRRREESGAAEPLHSRPPADGPRRRPPAPPQRRGLPGRRRGRARRAGFPSPLPSSCSLPAAGRARWLPEGDAPGRRRHLLCRRVLGGRGRAAPGGSREVRRPGRGEGASPPGAGAVSATASSRPRLSRRCRAGGSRAVRRGRPCAGEGGSRRGGRREPGPPRLTAARRPFLPWKCPSWPHRQPGASCSAEAAGSAGREKPLPSVRVRRTHARSAARRTAGSSPPPPRWLHARLAGRRDGAPLKQPRRRAAPPWPRRAPMSPKS